MKDEDIFDVLDGIASEETMRQHEVLLLKSAEYQILFKQYAHTHALLVDTSIEKTAFNFTNKLINRWEFSQEIVVVRKSYELPIYFLGVMSVMIILLALIVLPMSSNQAMKMDLSGLITFFQNKLIVRSIMFINALIGFYFLDKQVLRPYFQKRFGA